MDWDRARILDDYDERRRGGSDSEASGAASAGGCLRVAAGAVFGFLLLFNAIAISRVQQDVETRVAAAEAATMARLTALEREVALLRADPSRIHSAVAADMARGSDRGSSSSRSSSSSSGSREEDKDKSKAPAR